MELLPEGQKNTQDVTWEDQQKINDFSTKTNRKDRLSVTLKSLQTEKEYLDDLGMELELVDDDEPIRYKVGDAFALINHEEAGERIEKQTAEIDEQIETLESQIEELDDSLGQLKHDLNAKFGDSINLER